MSHECEDCGRTFETLTRLRTHDCGDDATGGATGFDLDTDDAGTDAGSSSVTADAEREASVPALDDALERVFDGEYAAIYEAVGVYESALSSALDDGGDAYRDVFWAYYEDVAVGVDRAVRAEGWSHLDALIDAYDPTAGELPYASPAIENATGRYLIRTRVTDEVAAVEPGALEYLDAVATHAGDADDTALEEVHAYGWGIGHPDHAVVDRLQERAREEVSIFSINPTLEHAFYADQHAAVDALERLVTDESIDGALPRFRGDDMPYRRAFLDCVYSLKLDDWPMTPRYWDWHEELDYEFELDDEVERRIRDLVAAEGFDADLPDDWSFRDLAI